MELVTLHLEQARQGEHHSFSHLQSKEQEVGDTQSSPPSPPQLAYLRTLSGVLAHHLLPPSYTQTPVPPPPLAPGPLPQALLRLCQDLVASLLQPCVHRSLLGQGQGPA